MQTKTTKLKGFALLKKLVLEIHDDPLLPWDAVPCVIWPLYVTREGHGIVCIGDKKYVAHREAYRIAHGDIPKREILHRCPNGSCIRPSHLYPEPDAYQLLREMAGALNDDPTKPWSYYPCMEWPMNRSPAGYGRVFKPPKGTPRLAHREAYMLVHGPIPDGLDALHHCDNPPCFRVAHLFLGKDLDNVKDCIAKCRNKGRIGENNWKSKLTAEQVLEIRRLHDAEGMPDPAIGRMFKVSAHQICMIVNRKHWRHI